MPAPLPPRDPPSPLRQTANDRFKAQAITRGAWAFSLAAGAHAALFVLTPAIEGAGGWLEGPPERPDMEVVALADLPAPRDGPGAPTLLEREDEGDGAADGNEGAEDHGDAPHEGSDNNPRAGPEDDERASGALRHRLRSEAPEPDVVEPEEGERDSEETAREDEDVREGEEEDEGAIDIEGSPAALDEDELPEADEPDLDRLAGESPEIAVQAPSHWVLVENPEDVREFIEEGYEVGRLEDGKEGGVLVILWIDEVGSVEWAEVARSSGDEDMDQVAVELFEDVVSFRPARDQGVRVPVSVQFWLHFPWRY